MRKEDLEYFVEVSRSPNLRQAAKVLNVTQPTLSHSLARLDEELDTQLFFRSNKGLRLTQEGKKAQKVFNHVLEELLILQEEINRDKNNVSGRVSLGCHPSVAIYFLPTLLQESSSQFPKLEYSLSHAHSAEILKKVLGDEIEFGLVINPESHNDLVLTKLLTDEVNLFCSEKIEKTNRSVLIYDPNLHQSKSLLEQLKKRKINFTRKLESANLEVISTLVDSGLGVGILPKRVARGKVKLFDSTIKSFKDQLYLVYKPHQRRRFLGTTFVNLVKQTSTL